MNIVGGLLGIYLVTALRRRVFVIGTFLVMAVVLCITAAQAQLPTGVILTSFFVFILTSSAASLIQFVYPPELFPTEIRATGIGIGAAASRIGATVSTFAMPIVMASVGASWTFIMLAAICMIGAIASLLWAPETKNFTLTESSVIRLPKGQAEADQMPITSDRQS